MTVLSDKTIKEGIAKKELIPGGVPENATHCSYEFTAGLILQGGSHKLESIDSGVSIEPSQLVWIKTQEEISMPEDMVGLWIQTQTLSRQGLLLLNISLIEPGYKGPLSAVFVNFGKDPVLIKPDTKIAKVVFIQLDNKAINLVKGCDSRKYNNNLMDIAIKAPKTFLQLQSFEQKANIILEQMEKQMDQDVKNLASQAKDEIGNSLKSDIRNTLLKWGGPIFGGLILGCLIVWLMISSYLPTVSEYAKIDEITRTLAISQQAETITDMEKKIRSLTIEIESIKEQNERNNNGSKPLNNNNNFTP